MEDHDFADLVHLDLDVDLHGFEFPAYNATHDDLGKLPEPFDLDLLEGQDGRQQQSHLHQPPAAADADGAGSSIFDFGMPISMPFDEVRDHSYALASQLQHSAHHPIIPPTPNSVEMHGDAARYFQQINAHNRAILEQHYQMRNGDTVTFTPLVSPAVTPHENRLHVHQDYTISPGAYFSPLTSPALSGKQGPQQAGNTSASSVATSSPIDLDVDMLDESALPHQNGNKKESRKRPGSSRDGIAPSGRVSQSNSKARRKPQSSIIPAKEIQIRRDKGRQPHSLPTSPTAAHVQFGLHGSASNSISPEPLSELLMGPPPKPMSARVSPAIMPRSSPGSNQAMLDAPGGVPATPASLMHMPQARARNANGPTQGSPTLGATPTLDDMMLPEAGMDASHALNGDEFGETTPRISARKTPKLGPLATPGSSALSAKSNGGSPAANGLTSQTASPIIGRKIEPKSRMGKKRASVGNAPIMSPALRPRISPSIKPLLPEGAARTEDSHTLFLATRSNYQNLIEGTHVPGVNYPQELSTNLTSKRTSHKIAEQGRRNRINVALQEMHALLPNSHSSPQMNAMDSNADADEEDERNGKGGGKGGGGNSSKAATVENAIDYIRFMQQQNRALELGQSKKDQEIEELKKRISDMQDKLGGISTSESAMSPTAKSKAGKKREPKE